MAELEGWEVSRLIDMSPAQIVADLKAYADAVERFRRGVVLASLFDGQLDRAFKEGVEAIQDDGFLRDLEHFGAALSSAARSQRTKVEARRVGRTYGAGA